MIEIKNLTKIYKIKNKNECIAVNDVSFVLPDKGMVFIVGKSGSGKSTLLNLIGGLDIANSGTIIADGNEITKMKNYELTKYRSSYVGFIFQDYHVLDAFTVYQNIKLSLDIRNQKDDGRIKQILETVDLTDYQENYPTELSGGQKQRIAVARALAKDAQLILCDEPTGNLDKKTSKAILEMLKQISHQKLVVIVSHSNVDADTYADRIIELYDGMIIRDRVRSINYNNDFRIEKNIAYLPHYHDLSHTEVERLNEEIKNNDELQFKQINNRFYETGKITTKKEPFIITPSKITRRTSKNLFKMFFKNKKAYAIFSILLTSILLVCFSIFQSFLSFNSNEELSSSLTSHGIYSIPLQKGIFDDSGKATLSSIEMVTEEDINDFKDTSFEGGMYFKYNSTLPIKTYTIDYENAISIDTTLQAFYASESFGVINCPESFLCSIYGKNNQVNYLEKLENDDLKDYGIYIPDYIADSIIYHSTGKIKDYHDILGEYIYNKTTYGYINGIFDTDYETKYQELINKFNQPNLSKDEIIRIHTDIKDSEIYADFIVEAMNYLGYGYSFVDNYQEAIKDPNFRTKLRINNAVIKMDSENEYEGAVIFNNSLSKNIDLKENEIILSAKTYTTLFPYLDVNNFTPCEVVISFYNDYEKDQTAVYKKTYYIKELGEDNYINFELNGKLREFDVIKYGIYFDNHQNIKDIMQVADERAFIIYSADATKLSTINRVHSTFGKFFLFIELFFLLITIIFLVNIGISSIKKNKYEIGVLKSLGTSNFHIMKIFIRQSIIVCFSICIVANIGIAIGTNAANNILVTAFEQVLSTKFYDLKLIKYMPSIVFQDLIIIMIISFISFIIPQILLFRIKPIDIIRAKE